MIRIPVMGTKAWNIYKENWFSLDAPRHLHIQTLESMEILSSKTGFKIYDVVFDSGKTNFGVVNNTETIYVCMIKIHI